MNKRFLFFVLILFAVTTAGAQKHFTYEDSTLLYDKQQPDETENQATDDEEVEAENDILGDTGVVIRPVTISPDSLAAWKNKKEFFYARYLDSLLRAKENKEKQEQPQRSFKKSSSGSGMDSIFASGVVKIILWILAGLFVAYILYQLFLSKGNFRRTGPVSKVSEVTTDPDEYALLSNFDQLVHQACKLGDYRVATRYLFLKALQRLSDRSLIRYSIDKTNSRYIYELPENKRAEFASLVTIYEYSWYGNNAVDKATFTGIELDFNNFLNKI